MRSRISVKTIKIPVNSKEVTETLRLKPGINQRVAIFTSAEPSSPVRVKLITTEGQNEIHPLVTHLEYKPTSGGSHSDSRKELIFQAGQEIDITAIAENNISGNDFSFEIVFYIDDEN